MNLTRGTTRSGAGRGYTLIEVLVTLVIMSLLAALVLVAVGPLIRSTRVASEQQFLRSIGAAVEEFRRDFGFLPPLVDDRGMGGPPLVNDPVRSRLRPNILGETVNQETGARDFLRYRYTNFSTQPRSSQYSIPYYLIGVLSKDVDGVDGPGMTAPLADGSFSFRGRAVNPLIELRGREERLLVQGPDNRETVLLDRWERPILLFTWAPTFHTSVPGEPLFFAGAPSNNPLASGSVRSYNVPRFLGDPDSLPHLRKAGYAIVSLGEDGRIDFDNPDAPENADNLVYVEGQP